MDESEGEKVSRKLFPADCEWGLVECVLLVAAAPLAPLLFLFVAGVVVVQLVKDHTYGR